jgi:hypothetical protein
MDVILEKIKTFSDFLNESTNSDNFPLLKQEILKYKNSNMSTISVKILKYTFIVLGSKQYFNLLFSYQTEHKNTLKEQSEQLYKTLIDKKYDVDILQLLEAYIKTCVEYKKETRDDVLKNYFYGYCECDVVGSRNIDCYYYDFLEIELQYLRTRLMNDIGTIKGLKGVEGLKEFLENYKYNGILYYTNEKELIDNATELFWKEFENSDGTPFIVPLIKHFKKEYYRITLQHKALIEDVLDTDLMVNNISTEKNQLETIVSNILGYVDFISERMIEIDAQVNDEIVLAYHDKIIDDLENDRKITKTIQEFFQYVYGRLEIIYNLKKFVYDQKQSKNIH